MRLPGGGSPTRARGPRCTKSWCGWQNEGHKALAPISSSTMNKCLWVLLLAAACAAPLEAPATGVLRQAMIPVPPGFAGVFLSSPASGMADQFGHALAFGDFN